MPWHQYGDNHPWRTMYENTFYGHLWFTWSSTKHYSIYLYINDDCFGSRSNLTHCTTEEIVKESRCHLHRYFPGDYLEHCPDHIISSWVFIWQYYIFHAVDCFVPIRFLTDPQRSHYVWRHMKSLCLLSLMAAVKLHWFRIGLNYFHLRTLMFVAKVGSIIFVDAEPYSNF